jgi:16S rRNA (guanine1516-N2)-methyltransferase
MRCPNTTEHREAIEVTTHSTSENHRVVAGPTERFASLLATLGISSEENRRGAAVGDPDLPQEAFTLVEAEGRLELRPPKQLESSGISARFPPDRFAGTGSKSILVRAFGKRTNLIFDLTAGLGGDAYRLARAGHQVFASERHPAIYALLVSGWERDRELGNVELEVSKRLEFSHEEGVRVLDRIDQADVGVYLDPMYPRPRRHTALPKRELQVLRQLLGDEGDAALLLELARSRAARVVVKRPHRAPPLLSDVSFELSTKLVRFDVYVNPSLMRGTSS